MRRKSTAGHNVMVALRVVRDAGAAAIEAVDDLCDWLLAEQDNLPRSIEISRMGGAWPMVSVLKRGPWSALHLTAARYSGLLILESTRPDDAPEEVEFVYAGAPVIFTREYLISPAAAGEIVRAFAANEPWPGAARWVEI